MRDRGKLTYRRGRRTDHMKFARFLCALATLCSTGCFSFQRGSSRCYPTTDPSGDPFASPSTPSGPSTAQQLPASCRPSAPAALQSLYDVTETSVHELITCGGLQMKVAESMKLMIFSSNEG